MNVSGTVEAIISRKGPDIWSIAPDATVLDAIRLMAEKNVGALLVMRGAELLGVVSERDYTRKVILRGKSSRETQVGEIMSSQVTVAQPRETVEECLRVMTERHIRHLPIVENGAVRGVVSIGDLVKQIISAQHAALDQLEDFIAGKYPA